MHENPIQPSSSPQQTIHNKFAHSIFPNKESKPNGIIGQGISVTDSDVGSGHTGPTATESRDGISANGNKVNSNLQGENILGTSNSMGDDHKVASGNNGSNGGGSSQGTEQFQTSMQFSIRNVINQCWKSLLTQEKEKFGFNQDVITSGLVEKLDSKQKLTTLEKKIRQQYSFFKQFLDSDLAIEFYGLIFVSIASILRIERCRLELEALEEEEEEKIHKALEEREFKEENLNHFTNNSTTITEIDAKKRASLTQKKNLRRNTNQEIIEAIKSAVFDERELKKSQKAKYRRKKKNEMMLGPLGYRIAHPLGSRSGSRSSLVSPQPQKRTLSRSGSRSSSKFKLHSDPNSRSNFRIKFLSETDSRSSSRFKLNGDEDNRSVKANQSLNEESGDEEDEEYPNIITKFGRLKQQYQDAILESNDQLSRLSVAYSHILSQYRFPNDTKKETLFFETLYLFAYKIVVAKFSSHPILNGMIRDKLANLFRTNAFHRTPEDRMRLQLNLKSNTINYMRHKDIQLPKANIFRKLQNSKQRSPLMSYSLPSPDVSVYNFIGNPRAKCELEAGLDIPTTVLFHNIAMENEVDEFGQVKRLNVKDKKRENRHEFESQTPNSSHSYVGSDGIAS